MIILPLLLSFALPAIASLTNCTSTNTTAPTYDYIITGSGPGGGTLAVNLALANYSVLLIEAGDDASSDISTVIHSLNQLGSDITWSFYVKHGDDEERAKRYNLMVWKLANGDLWVGRNPAAEGHIGAQRMGVYYPRGATLGGSAIVNAAVAFLPSDSDWDFFESGQGNGTAVWSAKDMRRIFQKIEKNNYLQTETPGHGFNGWLQINTPDHDVYSPENLLLKYVRSAVKLIGDDPAKVIDYAIRDPNGDEAGRDQSQGLFALPYHVSKGWRRFSPRDRILAAHNATTTNGAKKYTLDLQLNSLTTKVLFDTCGDKPKAIGVEWIEGAAVYKGDPRFNSTVGKVGRAFARKEIIVSGGAFNSPQILQLSGVGPKALLEKYNIPVVADLPGVGRNLQENYEMPIVGYSGVPAVDPVDPNAPQCSHGALGDPCVELWKNGSGPYAHGSTNGFAFMLKTNHSLDGERDMLMFSTGGGHAFRGFKPQTKQNLSEPLNTLSWSTVKMHPQNTKGYVQIRSSNPQDTPEINFQHFAEGAETDVGAMLDTVAFARKSFSDTEAPVGPVKPVEPPCPAADIKEDGYCKVTTSDTEWYKDQVFGHHPTSSCSVGSDDNPLAVLDTRLRVRGVDRLRVVDASAFPRIPGAFPAVATFMLGEKASELVLEDAAAL